MAVTDKTILRAIYVPGGIIVKKMSESKSAKLSLKITCMSILTLSRLPTSPLTKDENTPIYEVEYDITTLRALFHSPIDMSTWDGEDITRLEFLWSRLENIRNGDKLTLTDVILMADVLEFGKLLDKVGISEWFELNCEKMV